MSRVRVQATIRLTLESPFVSQGLTSAGFGFDVAQARGADGKVLLPGDLLRGNLRQAFLDLGFDPGPLFGRESADGDEPARGRLILGDLVAVTSESNGASLTRIEIADDTGSVESGALVCIELPFPIGQQVVLEGPLILVTTDKTEIDRLGKALRLIPAIGAFKSVGFGRVEKAEIVKSSRRSLVLPSPRATGGDRVQATMTFDRPLLVDARRIADNVFQGAEVIPGAVLKGALAVRLDGALAQDLTAAVFGHAFPLFDDSETLSHQALPLSLVCDADQTILRDALHCDRREPPLPSGKAPKFRTDWKSPDDLLREHGLTPDRGFAFDTRTRTAIDPERGAAKDGQLFSYSMVVPGDCRWRAVIDRGDATHDGFRTLLAVLEEGLDGIGKSQARAEIRLSDAPPPVAEPVPGNGDLWALTLSTPALLNTPEALKEPEDLRKDYASYWRHAAGMELINFFATQRLAGGYQAIRYPSRKDGYYPWLLTEPGSVFLLKGDGTVLSQLLRGNLPLPPWLAGADWKTCPFIPGNGYGAFRLNAAMGVRHV
ncbi:MAG TPA: RAMP superfamily CRISPR-associated protein [Magnetospirillum sp.]|nr:RAMP superfamily CRISPR-associated protein [Magnetospirillum sp.]